MSLPEVRRDLHLDNKDERELWPARMKEKVVDLATEAREARKRVVFKEINRDLLIAYNGAGGAGYIPESLDFCKIIFGGHRKRDDIPGDPFSETVCIQAPLQCLEECLLSIALGPRCLHIAVINVVWLIPNRHCHIKIIIFNFDPEWN
jgi:hypothetical protein